MIVAHVIVGLECGGAEAVLARLCVGDRSNRHIVISMMGVGVYGVPLRNAGVEVHSLDMPRGVLTWAGARRLWRLLRERRPDVVQTWMYHADLIGGIAASLAGIEHRCWGVRSGSLLWTHGQRRTMVLRGLSALLSWFVPTAIICNSAAGAAVHRRLGYRGRTMCVIPNGVDPEAFRPDPELGRRVREELGVAQDLRLIGAVGRNTPYKGYDILLAALGRLASQHVSLRCVIVGDGVAGNEELAAAVRRHGLDAHVLLMPPRRDVSAVMNALDVLVLSSVAEAFPSVLIEAMACGTPCVTTDVGDARYIVGETGWIVPRGRADALANALAGALRELRNRDASRARRAACRTRVMEQFTLDRMVQAYTAVWKGRPPRGAYA